MKNKTTQRYMTKEEVRLLKEELERRPSTLFTKKQLKHLYARLNGDHEDYMGVYHQVIKPRMREILEVWLPRAKKLKKMTDFYRYY